MDEMSKRAQKKLKSLKEVEKELVKTKIRLYPFTIFL